MDVNLYILCAETVARPALPVPPLLIDHRSPFLDAAHVVIGTGDVMGARSYSRGDI